MKIFLWTVGPGLVALVGFWIGLRLALRRHERRAQLVTPAWLNEHVYTRTGDDHQAK